MVLTQGYMKAMMDLWWSKVTQYLLFSVFFYPDPYYQTYILLFNMD